MKRKYLTFRQKLKLNRHLTRVLVYKKKKKKIKKNTKKNINFYGSVYSNVYFLFKNFKKKFFQNFKNFFLIKMFAYNYMNFYWKTFGFFSQHLDFFFFYKNILYFNKKKSLAQFFFFFVKNTLFNELLGKTCMLSSTSLYLIKKKTAFSLFIMYKIFLYLHFLKKKAINNGI